MTKQPPPNDFVPVGVRTNVAHSLSSANEIADWYNVATTWDPISSFLIPLDDYKPNESDKANKLIFGKILPRTGTPIMPPTPTPAMQKKTDTHSARGEI
ncbi:hypothetical protein AC578_6519 [Pseudocercospora eumusae]|uniref:Uncharacterized protein n=1 Tax=Pseudocercospora eumusae TaxID=321146 RepID=A0A139HHN9_9PEZI|nr:hypothetical protein AC578_6519 [Pseudocercospora eumusae]